MPNYTANDLAHRSCLHCHPYVGGKGSKYNITMDQGNQKINKPHLEVQI